MPANCSRTRVDITLQQQNQSILSTTARRATLLLHQQQTAKGLSVAAIGYYVVGLIGSAAKTLKAARAAVDPDIIIGAAIPLAAVVAAALGHPPYPARCVAGVGRQSKETGQRI